MTARTRTARCLLSVVSISLWLMMPLNTASADFLDDLERLALERLSAQWQQWALSIPTAVNPELGADNANPALDYSTLGKCVVGQRGAIWFLAGPFGGGAVTRTCSVPEGKWLFFPVVNSVNVNSPNICGEGPQNLTVRELRRRSADFINGATNLIVEVDGRRIFNMRRVQSRVFEVALPESNIFDAPCGPAGVPAGIYSPGVDDGYYVLLDPLRIGNHMLRIHAENPSQQFILDVTFKLNVVPVSRN